MAGVPYFDPMQGQITLGVNNVKKFNPNHGSDGKFVNSSDQVLDENATKDPATKEKNRSMAETSTVGKDAPEKVKALIDHLTSVGFHEEKAGDKSGSRWFRMDTAPVTNDNLDATHHSVVVHPDGSWDHSSEGMHSGSSLDNLKAIRFAEAT